MNDYLHLLRAYFAALIPDQMRERSEAGQGMIEYVLIIGVVVLALLAAYQVTPLGTAVSGVFTNVIGSL